MDAYIYTPDNQLSEAIDYMWFDAKEGVDMRITTLPFMHQELIINFGEEFSMQTGDTFYIYTKEGAISGLWQKQMTTRVAGKYNAIGIMLKPQGLHTLFGINAATLAQPQTLHSLWGQGVQNAIAPIEHAATPQQKIKALEKLLLSTAKPQKTNPTVMEFAQMAHHQPLQKGGQKNYLGSKHFSQKKFISSFSCTFGLTPQKYWQLKQVNNAIAQIAQNPQTPLVQIAVDCGFYDQAHFIHLFKRYTGIAPLAYKKMAQAGKVHQAFPNSINA